MKRKRSKAQAVSDSWKDPATREARTKRYRCRVDGQLFNSLDQAWDYLGWPRDPETEVIYMRRRLRDSPTHREVYNGHKFELLNAEGRPL